VGCVVERRLPADARGGPRILRGVIIETEAYRQNEPGCHAFRGRTKRTETMFGPPGTLYVYFTYGNWHMLNVVCEPPGQAAAVLIRGLDLLDAQGQSLGTAELSNGPGLLCRELAIDRRHDKLDALSSSAEIRIYRPARLYSQAWAAPPLSWTTRVGFSWEDPLPWRCIWSGHPALRKVSLRPLKRKTPAPV
jgi:DNA-3-methyladenine glycosylase